MKTNQKLSAYSAQMNLYEFKRISEFIQNNFGIKLPEHKRVMVQGRLHKRLAALNMTSFASYVHYLFSEEGVTNEIPVMVDLISTNKTNFFRESAHFNTLTEIALPDFVQHHKFSTLNVWSAGCSSGEEVYTLGMVINSFFEQHKGYRYKILGTDISRRMLEKASKAIYPLKDVENIPLHLKKRYLLKNKNKEIPKIRIVPELREKTQFAYLNFMAHKFDLDQMFDIVFCRNVLIYFERHIQKEVLLKILAHIKPNGYLFLGHSESITDMNLPVQKISPTVFKKLPK
jgi:chemotaxis protein methyltransferase CheR